MAKKDVAIVESSADFESFMTKYKKQFEQLIPKHVGIDRFMKVAIMAVSKQPKLLKCCKISVLKALMESAEMGLEVGTSLQHAALVPFWNGKRGCLEAQFMPMYQGLAELIMRTGKVSRVSMVCVYKDDVFEYNLGTDPGIHKHTLGSLHGQDQIENVTHAYAVAWMKGAEKFPQFVLMNRTQIDLTMAKSASVKAKEKFPETLSPWDTDFGAMSMKSAFKLLSKLCPKSVELSRAIELDNQADVEPQDTSFEIIDEIVSESTKQLTATENLEKKLASEKPPVTKAKSTSSDPKPPEQQEEPAPPADDPPPPVEEEKEPVVKKLKRYCVKCGEEKQKDDVHIEIGSGELESGEIFSQVLCKQCNGTAEKPPAEAPPVGGAMSDTSMLDNPLKDVMDAYDHGGLVVEIRRCGTTKFVDPKEMDRWIVAQCKSQVIKTTSLSKAKKLGLAQMYLNLCKLPDHG